MVLDESPLEDWPVVPVCTLSPGPEPELVKAFLIWQNTLGPVPHLPVPANKPAAVEPTLAKPDKGDMHIVCLVVVGTV